MLENGKELDRSPDLFWTINSLVLAHHCHLSSGDGNVCLIFHQKMELHFFLYEKSSFFVSEITQCFVSQTHY